MCVRGVDDQCVLQFTLVNATGCALHRRTSRVIHRIELYFVGFEKCQRQRLCRLLALTERERGEPPFTICAKASSAGPASEAYATAVEQNFCFAVGGAQVDSRAPAAGKPRRRSALVSLAGVPSSRPTPHAFECGLTTRPREDDSGVAPSFYIFMYKPSLNGS